ncbi:MAG TPA: coproporphyrinogen-III oxidase family protein, partial [Saprospiraceae bacterium]|nr:coproporphyrinogen-III oxidase family protein [Saprospiraceae bacterium]
LRLKASLLHALSREMEMRRDYLHGLPLGTVYLGGGTPSLLSISELVEIFEHIESTFPLISPAYAGMEVTLEANPDDLSPQYLHDLRHHTPVNRLSIGIQSFSEHDLRWMNRAHNADHARQCLQAAAQAGFHDLSVDLIYGSPTTSDAQWAANLDTVLEAGIPPLSAYCLTVEPGTALGHWVKKGSQPPPDEERAAAQFEHLMRRAAAAGYEHYEISNFALPDRYARHNTSYWQGASYLGIGPAAHSFDGHSRQWNVANNPLYIKAIEENRIPCEVEALSPAMRYNEYVMTALRTMWGVDAARLSAWGEEFAQHFRHSVQPFLADGTVEAKEQHYRLSPAGKLLADRIAAGLFL